MFESRSDISSVEFIIASLPQQPQYDLVSAVGDSARYSHKDAFGPSYTVYVIFISF
jgi:hypothetical protein